MNQAARDIIAKHEALTGPIQKEVRWVDKDWAAAVVDGQVVIAPKLRSGIAAKKDRAARRWLEAL